MPFVVLYSGPLKIQQHLFPAICVPVCSISQSQTEALAPQGLFLLQLPGRAWKSHALAEITLQRQKK